MNFINLNEKRLKLPIQLLVSVFILTAFLLTTSATLSVGTQNYSISKTYGPSTNISGWLNISTENEPTNSTFRAYFNGDLVRTMSLESVLKENPSYNYSCSPLDCKENYLATNPQTTKQRYMAITPNPTMIGFKLEGNIQSVDSVSFDITNDLGASCSSQVKLDILKDGTIDVINNKTHATDICNPKSYGCFNSSKTLKEFTLTPGKQYCQRINLTQYSGFALGSWIKKNSGDSIVVMSLHDLNGIAKKSCTITNVENLAGQDYSCKIDYMVSEPEEHFLCVYLSGGNGNYQIRGYSETESACAFPGVPGETEETAAYDLYAQGRKFAPVGTISISNNFAESETISTKIWEYLLERYGIVNGEVDCSSQECAIPIDIISDIPYHTTSLGNLNIRYDTDAGQITENNFYDLTQSPTKVTSNFQAVRLETLGITTLSEAMNYTFRLSFDGQTSILEKIEVKDIPTIKSLTPTIIAAAFPTEFKVEISIPENTTVKNYFWDFGDNYIEKTNSNRTTHSYNTTGNYTIKITVQDLRGLNSSKSFEINVTSPKNLIQERLLILDENLKKIKENIRVQKVTHQTNLNSILNIEDMTSKIETLKKDYNDSETEEDYKRIVEELITINIPERVFITTRADLIELFPSANKIDLAALEQIGGGSYDINSAQQYIEAITTWQQDNIEIKVNFSEFSAEYPSGIKPLVRMFDVQVDKKQDTTYDSYLILQKENLIFNSPIQEKGNFVYANLQRSTKISFYTTGSVDFENLNAFVAPPINRLSIDEYTPQETEGKISKEVVVLMSIFFLIILAVIIYIFLQQWYKKKYESHLFPHRNDFYNIIHYINNAKKKEHTDKEITQSLKKAGWGSEQITYALKKYEGKRTGMFELPLPNLFKKKE